MNLRSEWHFLLLVEINLFFNKISIPLLCAHANFEVNTRSIYARNYDFLSVALKKISTVYLYTNDDSFSRSVLVKYSDRGLADDAFWFNGGLKLFEILFWIINIFLMMAHETNITILFFTGRMHSSLRRWTYGILSLVIIFILPVVQLQNTEKPTKNRPS